MARSRVRATVSTVSPVASVQIILANAGNGVVAASTQVSASALVPKLTASWDATVYAATAIVPLAALKWFHIVYVAEEDYIGRNPVIRDISLVVDVARLGVGKGFADTNTASDYLHPFQLGKGLSEALSTAETRVFSIQKAFADYLTATDDFQGNANIDDDQVVIFSKSLAVEQQTVSDTSNTEFGKGVVDPVVTGDQLRVVDLAKGLTEAQNAIDVRTTSYEKELADAVDAGDEFNASAITDDGEIMIFGKTVSDTFVQSDEVSVQAEKNIDDPVAVGDQLQPFELGKGIEDAAVTSEQRAYTFGKPLEDFPVVSDAAPITFNKPIFDDTNYPSDGPNQYDTYAISYFLEDYAREGFPALGVAKVRTDQFTVADSFSRVMAFARDPAEALITADNRVVSSSKALADALNGVDVRVVAFSKARTDSATMSDLQARSFEKTLTELVDATDDFQGAVNPDDEQVMLFSKGVSDYTATSEANTVAFSKARTDTAVSGDSKAVDLSKARADAVASSDAAAKGTGKTLADSFASSDAKTSFVGKSATDAAATSDSRAFSSSKALADTVAKSDAAAKEVGKTLADTFTKADTTRVTAGKVVAETTVTSETNLITITKAIVDSVISTDDFYGTANADDDETKSFSTVKLDSVSKSDTASVTAGKGLTDTVSKSDAGSMVWTDYWDINYTVTSSGVYVGSSQSF